MQQVDSHTHRDTRRDTLTHTIGRAAVILSVSPSLCGVFKVSWDVQPLTHLICSCYLFRTDGLGVVVVGTEGDTETAEIRWFISD